MRRAATFIVSDEKILQESERFTGNWLERAFPGVEAPPREGYRVLMPTTPESGESVAWAGVLESGCWTGR
jgi:hypothetical protein